MGPPVPVPFTQFATAEQRLIVWEVEETQRELVEALYETLALKKAAVIKQQRLQQQKQTLQSIRRAIAQKDRSEAESLLSGKGNLLAPATRAALKKEITRLPWPDPVTGMEFVRVPGGSFEMGCHANAGKCDSDEKPVRTVRLDGFWMGKHEVTQGQWKRIMGSNPSYLKKGDNYPVENVSWNEVQQFIHRLNRQSSAKFRLPSEAQWEYACRAGGKAVTYGTGSGALNSSSAKYCTGDGTALVGSCDPNSLGLHDMSGNVWEWVRDKFIMYGNVGTDNPIFERSSDARVFRGGGRNGNSSKLRCSDRPRNSPSFSGGVLGFRLVRMW